MASSSTPGNLGSVCGKELLLHFVRDGELIFQLLPLALLLDQRGDRLRHGIERFAERRELVAVRDPNTKRKIAGLHMLRSAVEVVDGVVIVRVMTMPVTREPNSMSRNTVPTTSSAVAATPPSSPSGLNSLRFNSDGRGAERSDHTGRRYGPPGFDLRPSTSRVTMPVISLSNGFTARGTDRCCVAICCSRVYPCRLITTETSWLGRLSFRAQHVELDGAKFRRQRFDQLRRDRNNRGDNESVPMEFAGSRPLAD